MVVGELAEGEVSLGIYFRKPLGFWAPQKDRLLPLSLSTKYIYIKSELGQRPLLSSSDTYVDNAAQQLRHPKQVFLASGIPLIIILTRYLQLDIEFLKIIIFKIICTFVNIFWLFFGIRMQSIFLK
ncbi:hypothetical protein DsansV1_C06g0061251 [Dioscorea sansibarensis]